MPNPFDYQHLINALQLANAGVWADIIPAQVEQAISRVNPGQLQEWHNAVESLPGLGSVPRQLDTDAVTIGRAGDLTDEETSRLENLLHTFKPWRKGPFDVCGIFIDTEWRSDWKWQRVIPHIAPLAGRCVLDVGCGNGYHGWRMLGAGAGLVIGVDPLPLNVVQFWVIKKLYGEAPVYVLPVGIEAVPDNLKLFDTVFSMGVLYHRRSPIDHLFNLRACLRPGGELVLETLVIDGGPGQTLVPEGRYAQMRNVWFLPSCETLAGWLKRCGFDNIRLADVCVTTTDEQRSTPWMRTHSLKDFLDPANPALTCEGYPAPKRAIFIANAGY